MQEIKNGDIYLDKKYGHFIIICDANEPSGVGGIGTCVSLILKYSGEIGVIKQHHYKQYLEEIKLDGSTWELIGNITTVFRKLLQHL